MDDDLLPAISDPIPRGLVPLTAEERREDWARLYDTPMRKVTPPRDLSEVPFEMVHHCE